MTITAHVYQIYINADADRVWSGITESEWKRRYFHGTSYAEGPVAGARYRTITADGRDAVDGVIEVMEPPGAGAARPLRADLARAVRRRAGRGAAEPGRVDHRAGGRGAHPGAPRPRRPRVQPAHLGQRQGRLGLGARRPQDRARDRPDAAPGRGRDARSPAGRGDWHRRQGVEANNAAMALLDVPERDAAADEDLLRLAYAAAYHWERATRPLPRERRPRGVRRLAGAHRDRPARPRPGLGGPLPGDSASTTASRTSTWPTPTRRGPGRCTASAAAPTRPTPGPPPARSSVADAEDREIVESDLARLEPLLG